MPPGAPISKYARRELERRFLAAAVPAQPAPVRVAEITDLYLSGTRMRVRRHVSRASSGTEVLYKLTQKIPDTGGTPVWITTLYLSEAEHGVLARLGGFSLEKTRYSIPPFGVDVFQPPLDGLVLAEIEFGSEHEMRRFRPPAWSAAEVTTDVRFTGGRLVATSREELTGWLKEYGIELSTA